MVLAELDRGLKPLDSGFDTMREKLMGAREIKQSWVLILGVFLCVNCSEKKKKESIVNPKEIVVPDGFEYIPAETEMILNYEVAAVGASPLVKKVVQQYLVREPGLKTRIDELFSACDIDLEKNIDQIAVALGRSTDESLLVAKGRLSEPAIKECVQEAMKTSGGSLVEVKSTEPVVYQAKRSSGSVWFAFPKPGIVAVAKRLAWLRRAVGNHPKIKKNSVLMGVIRDGTLPDAHIWGAGLPRGEIGAGLVKVSQGKVVWTPSSILSLPLVHFLSLSFSFLSYFL